MRKKLEMFVIRVNQMGDLVNSKPCNTCIYYMQLYGIKSVYYSNEDGIIIKENQQSVGKYWIKRLFLVAFQSKINVNKTFKNIIIKLTAKSISSIII